MTIDPRELLSRYFDDLLTEQEHQQLQDWLRDSSENAAEFVRFARLHDRLRGEQLAIMLLAESPVEQSPVGRNWRAWRVSAFIAAAVIALIVMLVALSQAPAVASTELRRLIAAQETELVRTYRIAVEDVPSVKRKRHNGNDERPPKPPLDGAVLHVRQGNQFVLIRPLPDGEKFVTGSNGRTSWAVRPDGPVRFSTDLTRFNRDLPGHEHGFPLLEIERGLSQLPQAYDIQLLPIESAEERDEPRTDDYAASDAGGGQASAGDSSTRLLVAVKKPGHRGPQRVEITYAVRTGQIRQLRFIEMPYGPNHLTVRLTQEEDRQRDHSFFDHQSHHDAARVVEEE